MWIDRLGWILIGATIAAVLLSWGESQEGCILLHRIAPESRGDAVAVESKDA